MGSEGLDLQCLSEGLSHILIEIPEGGLKFDPQAYLEEKGTPVEKQVVCTDHEGHRWLIVSLTMSDISKLILELIEKGLSGNIRGINLKA